MSLTRIYFALLLTMLLGGWSVAQGTVIGQLFWADSIAGNIGRADLDGSNNHIIISGLDSPFNMMYAASKNKIYWTARSPWSIRRTNLDGSNTEMVLNTAYMAYGAAIDELHQKIYWTMGKQICRANTDGTGAQTLVSTSYNTRGIALDPQAGKMYWTEFSNDHILRANLDGTHIENVLTTDSIYPGYIALDYSAHKLYWTDYGEIKRANWDGSGNETLLTEGNPIGITLDTIAGKMYWTSYADIKQANLDGSEVHTLITDLRFPNSIAIAYIPEPCTFVLVACGTLTLLRRRQ